MAPDIRIAGPPEHFRFAGIGRGLDWARKVLAEIAEDFEWLEYRVRELIAERDWVIALTGGRLRDRATGALHEIDLVDVIRLKQEVGEGVYLRPAAGASRSTLRH